MKIRTLLLPAVTAAALGYGVRQDGQEAVLKAELAALEARVVALETYLQAQAAGAKALESAIDSAVEKGYTAGINFEAREVLVAAWRKEIQTANQNVPGKSLKDDKTPVDPRVLRRRKDE